VEKPIVDFGFIGAFVFQSAFRNLQSAIPKARPVHEIEAALVFAQKVLAPEPGRPYFFADKNIIKFIMLFLNSLDIY